MEKKELRELYFAVLTEIYGFTEFELDKSNEIWFNYEGNYYFLFVDEKDIKTIELSFYCPQKFKDNDEKLKAIHLFNLINKKFKMVKMYTDDETGYITARVDLYMTGILSINNGFVFSDKQQFIEQLLEAITAIQSATEDFFDEMGWN